MLGNLAPQEDHFFSLAILQRPQAFAHAIARYHRTRQLRHLLQVIACTGRNIAKDNLFCRTATQHTRHAV